MKVIIFSIVLFTVAACVIAQTNPQKCPENSKWNDCGTICPTTCKQQTPPPCTKQCHPSCQCNDGRVWNDSHQCVHISECPKIVTTSAPKL